MKKIRLLFFHLLKPFTELHKNNISLLTHKIDEKEIIEGIKEKKLAHYSEFVEYNLNYKVIRDKLLIMEQKSKKKNG